MIGYDQETEERAAEVWLNEGSARWTPTPSIFWLSLALMIVGAIVVSHGNTLAKMRVLA